MRLPLIGYLLMSLFAVGSGWAADELVEGFRQPLPEYSPVPIWWWSGDPVEPARISEQLERIAAGGMHHAIVLNLAPSGPLYGSAADEPPFLSEQWWELFDHAVQEGKRVGVRLWFYDQLGFSGAGLQARVVRDNPEFRGVNLARKFRDVTGPGRVRIEVPPGAEAVAAFIAQRAERDDAAKAMLGEQFRNVRNLSDEIKEGAIAVEVPAGEHRVQLFYTTAGGFNYHNPAAGTALIEIVHGQMEKRFGQELGKAIAGSFQDEFPPMPRFSRLLPEQFRKQTGYDLLERLPALYDDIVDNFGQSDDPGTVQIRCDANLVAAKLCEEAFFKPCYDWHARHGMICGYDQTVRNGSPMGGEGYYVDYYRLMRHYGAPGAEQSGSPKPHQSIAELYDRPRVWMEGFHSSGWGQTLEDIAALLQPWLAHGATLYNPHAIYYSIHGSFWEWAPPDTGWRQPYYRHYPVLADYVSRLCWILTQGKHVNQVAMLYPASTMHACRGFGEPTSEAKRTDDTYWATYSALLDNRLDFLILDEDSLDRSAVVDGKLAINKSAFGVVILPNIRVISSTALQRLIEFAQAGGTVIAIGGMPKYSSDLNMAADKFVELAASLGTAAIKLADAGKLAAEIESKTGRDVTPPMPALHHKIGERDFYFLLADDVLPMSASAEYEVNDRNFHKFPPGQGARVAIDVAVDGVPELWDALSGAVLPIYNYKRQQARTEVQVELSASAAPLLAIRPAKPDEPLAIESDLEILSAPVRTAGGVRVRGLPRWDRSQPPTREHRVRVAYRDAAYEIAVAAPKANEMLIRGPFSCKLEPTCDNRDGSFSWPPSDGPVPVEIRSFRYHAELPGQNTGTYRSAELNDRGWETVQASYGPRGEWAGPFAMAPATTLESMDRPAAKDEQFKPIEYSLKLGINEDPIYSSALGGKGRIPEEFIDLGEVQPNNAYLVRTRVQVPGDASLPAILRIGGAAAKRAWFNGRPVQFAGEPAARVLRTTVELNGGDNTLELLAARQSPGRLRLFYQFAPLEGMLPDPQWIWADGVSPTGRWRFAKQFEVAGQVQSAAMVVALGELHQIRLNGELVADQGNFDPYFTSRSERYDITALIRGGTNLLEIEARDPGSPVGLLLDGAVQLVDGRQIAFVSDGDWQVAPAGDKDSKAQAVKVLANPSAGYMGETATLLLQSRPHPLPLGGFLLDQAPPPAPFDRLLFSPTTAVADQAGWYRFVLPPGATKMHLQSPAGSPKLYTADRVQLFVEGKSVFVECRGDRLSALLPQPQAPRRVAALRIVGMPGYTRGAAITAPITFEIEPGQIPLGSWDELGLPHYSGHMVYSMQFELPSVEGSRVLIDLGRIRGSAEVTVNGKPAGTRIWHPYRFDLTGLAVEGSNQLDIRVCNTLGPHFGAGHPSNHVFKNHTRSGLFGPVVVRVVEPLELTLSKAPG